MKLLVLMLGVAVLSCSSKKTTMAITEDRKDEATYNAEKGSAVADTIPVCIKNLIETFKAEDKQNPPRKIYSYNYNNKTVYYVPPICCDFFSDLYDDKCTIIAHPDGGFTGRGDGKLPDFRTARNTEKLIWEDKRQ